MKQFLCAISVFISVQFYGQVNTLHIIHIADSFKLKVDDMITARAAQTTDEDQSYLVNDYTFNRRSRKEFANVLTGENSFSTLNKYATLEIDKASSKISFYLSDT